MESDSFGSTSRAPFAVPRMHPQPFFPKGFPRLKKSIELCRDGRDTFVGAKFLSTSPTKLMWYSHRDQCIVQCSSHRFDMQFYESPTEWEGVTEYQIAVSFNNAELKDQGFFSILAQNECGTVDVRISLLLGLDCNVRLTEESVFPPSCAPDEQHFKLASNSYATLNRTDGRLYADIRHRITNGECWFYPAEGGGYRQVERDVLERFMSRDDYINMVLPVQRAALARMFPEHYAQLEDKAEDDLATLAHPFWSPVDFIPQDFACLSPLYLNHLINFFSLGEFDNLRRMVKRVEVEKVNKKEREDHEIVEKSVRVSGSMQPRFRKDEKKDGAVQLVQATQTTMAERMEIWEKAYADSVGLVTKTPKPSQMKNGSDVPGQSSEENREKRRNRNLRFKNIVSERQQLNNSNLVEFNMEGQEIPNIGILPHALRDADIHTTLNQIDITTYIGGYPAPKIQWFMNKKLLRASNNVSMQSREIKSHDGSFFYQTLSLRKEMINMTALTITCRATNCFGEFDDTNVVYGVKHPLAELVEGPDQRKVHGVLGTELYCRLMLTEKAGNTMRPRWEYKGTPVYPGREDGLTQRTEHNGDDSVTLALMIEDTSKWAGDWKCFVDIGVRAASRKARGSKCHPLVVPFDVADPKKGGLPHLPIPHTFRERVIFNEKGQADKINAVITVFYTSETPSNYRWISPSGHFMEQSERFLMKEELGPDNRYVQLTLEIVGVLPFDAGAYSCMISNDVGAIKAKVPFVIEPDTYPRHKHGSMPCSSYVDTAKMSKKAPRSKGEFRALDPMKESCYLAEMRNQRVLDMKMEEPEPTEEQKELLIEAMRVMEAMKADYAEGGPCEGRDMDRDLEEFQALFDAGKL